MKLDHALTVDDHGRDRMAVGFDGDASRIEIKHRGGPGRRVSPDPIEVMKNRGDISKVQFEAAEKIREDYEIVDRHGLRAASFTEAVDGGKVGATVPDYMLDAATRVRTLFRAVGEDGEKLIVAAVIDRRSLRSLEEEGSGNRKNLAGRVSALLDVAAVHYGITSPPSFLRRKQSA